MKISLPGKGLAAASLLILLQPASAFSAIWYVASDGNDTNLGTVASPFATITKAQSAASSGDTNYLRGGTYFLNNADITSTNTTGPYCIVNTITKSGISYVAYPGETPVFNFTSVNPSGYRVTAFLVAANNCTFRGFEVTGVQVNILTHTQSECFRVTGSSNILEMLKMHDGMGIGVYLTGSGVRNNLILNCDAYRNWDNVSENGLGGNVDGFGGHPTSTTGTNNVFRGCRAWFNSDDGYDCINASARVTFDHCWALYNGFSTNFVSLGDGNGFKGGGYGANGSALPSPIPRHVIQFCVAVRNKNNGFYANHHVGGQDWFNNTAYRNSVNYNMLECLSNNVTDVPGYGHVMKNNLGYLGTTEVTKLDMTASDVSSNYFTLPVTVSSNDFASLDESLLTQPRQANGDLPDVPFAHLVNGSDLIDQGVDIGFPFSGSAPDLGAFESTSSPVAGLVWRGDGVTNTWDTIASNWFNGVTTAPFVNGSDVLFDDTGSNAPPINLLGALSPGSVAVNAGQNYTLGGTGSLTGAMALVKSGAGELILTTTNDFNGGVTLNLGALVLSNIWAAGTGAVTLNGGTLSLAASGSPAIYSNPFNVAVTSTLSTPGSGNNNQASSGTWSSNATVNVNTGAGGTFSVQGNMANFSGTIVLTGAGTFRFYSACTGSGSAGFDLGTSTAFMQARDGGPVNLGALSGGAGTILQGAGSSANPTTYIIGGNSADTTYSGTISNGSFSTGPAPTSIVKVGSGTLTLTGANTYSGGTTVSNGTLLVNNTVSSGTGTGAVTVASGGALSGSGTIGGPVTVNGALAPGYGVGTLTIGNDLVVNGGAVLAYELGAVSDLMVVSGNLTLGGTLNVTESGGFGAGSYTLFTYGGTLTYNGIAIGTAPAGYDYLIDTSTAHQVSLVVLTPFQQWQMNYFGAGYTNNPAAAASADPDGDGMSNTNEFLAGTDPTNSLSGLRIISMLPQGNDLNVAWTTAGGRTNAVQATAGDGEGGYDTNFSDISGPIVIAGSGDATTNYVDGGAVTNTPSRYYRIRLVP